MDPTDMLDKIGASSRPGPALRVLAIAAGTLEVAPGEWQTGVFVLRSDNNVLHYSRDAWRELPPVPGVSDAPAPLPTFDWLAGDRPPRDRDPLLRKYGARDVGLLEIPDPDEVLPALEGLPDDRRHDVFTSLGLITPEYIRLLLASAGDLHEAEKDITALGLHAAINAGKLLELARAVSTAAEK